jgi:hypothetical protein
MQLPLAMITGSGPRGFNDTIGASPLIAIKRHVINYHTCRNPRNIFADR